MFVITRGLRGCNYQVCMDRLKRGSRWDPKDGTLTWFIGLCRKACG